MSPARMLDATPPPVHGAPAQPWSSLGPARQAAAAILGGSPTIDVDHALASLHEHPVDELLGELVADQVDQLFLHGARRRGLLDRVPAALIDRLAARTLQAAAAMVRQDHVLREACVLLDQQTIPHVVFKGALARAFLYLEPQLRFSADADLLIPVASAGALMRALEPRGYRCATASHSDTHEMSVVRRGISLDLHWALFRPGRMRHDLADEILALRTRYGDLWGPDDVHLTVVMLVHPAITDHVTARLISAVDLDRWLRNRTIPWDAVVAVLDRIGLRTAAWAMLYWTRALLATPVPAHVWDALAVSPLRQRYLVAWLARHPARLYRRHPWWVRGAFSLALQDEPRDAARAIWRLARKHRLTFPQV